MSPEIVERIRQKNLGRMQSGEEKQMRSRLMRGYSKEHPEWRKRLSARGKEYYANHPEKIRQVLTRRIMSSLEQKAQRIILGAGLPYRFVGNGDFMIGGKCPDFVNVNGEKIAVEVYYRRHKEQFRGGLEKWKAERKNLFSQFGWNLLFFDETEVNEEQIANRLMR